jgi:hypothetical protein
MSKLQTTVALSSAEAEYMALAESAKEVIWLKGHMEFFGIPILSPITIFEDNQSAIAMAKNPVFHQRTKHIDTRYHFIRDLISNNLIQIKYCPTEEMIADILTKALPKSTFEGLQVLLNGYA